MVSTIPPTRLVLLLLSAFPFAKGGGATRDFMREVGIERRDGGREGEMQHRGRERKEGVRARNEP